MSTVIENLNFKICLLYFRTEEIKYGNLAGEDKFGNKYYENKTYFMGKMIVTVSYCLS